MIPQQPDHKRLFNHAPTLFVVLSPDLKIIDATEHWLSATLTKREEVTGRYLFDIFPDSPDNDNADGAGRLRSSFDRVLQGKVEDAVGTIKYEIPKDDGTFEEKYWSPINSPVFDDEGNVAYIINHVVDVTEYMLLKKKGREYEQLTGELQRKAERMEGEAYLRAQQLQQANEKLGRNNDELRATQQRLQQANEELQASQEELRAQQEELQELNSELRANNESLEKARMALLLKAEELERSSSFKTDFLSNMSHELRTPLNSMLILSKLLATNTQGNLSNKQVEQANIINKAGNDLLNLINDILDLSKIEAGKVEMVMEKANVADIQMDLEHIFNPVAAQRDIYFSANVASDVPQQILTDKFRLLQVLKNLLSNAFKFTPEQGHVTLLVSMVTSEADEGWDSRVGTICFAVADTGIGIPADRADDIFTAFRQVDGSTSRKYGGTGLGLSISRQLVGLLGGEIKLQSEEGKGSIFSIYLPVALGALPVKEREHTGKENAPGALRYVTIKHNSIPMVQTEERKKLFGGKTILVADDDERNVLALRMVLESYSIRLLVAGTGREALKAVTEHDDVSLVLMDIMMPEMDGFEAIRAMKSSRNLKHIPIIALTAKAMKSDLEKCLEAGANDYLPKPIDVGHLLSLMEVWLNKDVKRPA